MPLIRPSLATVALVFALAACFSAPVARAGNPLLPHVYAADPSAHVWPGDDRLWLYTSHDEPGTNAHSTMASYHVFSTRDLVNWTDHGRVFHLSDAKWAVSHMWAIDATYRHGKYYLIYCAAQKGDGIFRTGVAVSDRPEGPFSDLGPIQGVNWGQDPALFVDDDNTPYLHWGCGGGAHAAQLTDDLLSIVPGTHVDLSSQLTNYFEGSWVNKIKGRYYLTYPGLVEKKWPEKMFWAVADKPLGPYTYGGQYMDSFKNFAGTNHGSIFEYRGQWIAFYHSSWLSGGNSTARNLMADYLDFDEAGRLKPVIPTTEGVATAGTKPGPSRVRLLLEAETAPAQGGAHEGVSVAAQQPGFSGRGYVTGFDEAYDRVTFLAQVAKDGEWIIKARYAAPATATYTLFVGPIEKKCNFPASETFTEIDLGTFKLRAGDNRLQISRFPRRDGTGLALDALILEPAAQP
jgi:hypothetical protein